MNFLNVFSGVLTPAKTKLSESFFPKQCFGNKLFELFSDYRSARSASLRVCVHTATQSLLILFIFSQIVYRSVSSDIGSTAYYHVGVTIYFRLID